MVATYSENVAIMIKAETESGTRKYIYATDGHDSEPRPALGYMIMALAEAFLYAYLTKRDLVVDWRDTVYLAGKEKNLFVELFETPDEILGVKIVYDRFSGIDSCGESFIVDSNYYNGNIISWREPSIETSAQHWDSMAEERGFSGGGEDIYQNFPLKFIEEPIIRVPFVGAMIAGNDHGHTALKAFLAHLSLREQHRSEYEQFKRENFAGRRVCAVHVRHGNGEQGDFTYKDREIRQLDLVIDRICAQVGRIEAKEREDYCLFLATDSDAVVEKLRARLPNLITKEQWRPPVGEGISFDYGAKCPGGEIANAANAAIDLSLLGCCDYLIYHEPISWFARVAAKMIGQESSFAVSTKESKERESHLVIWINHANAGFFAHLTFVINQILYCEREGYTPVVYFGKDVPGGVNAFYDAEYGDNSWDYYFEPVKGITYEELQSCLNDPCNPQMVMESEVHRLTSDELWYLHENCPESVFNYPYGINSHHDGRDEDDWYREHRKKAQQVIKKYIRVKPHISKLVDEIYEREFSGNRVIGVHIRGSDKGTADAQPRMMRIIPPKRYFRHIDRYTAEHGPCRIFVATDQVQFLDIFKERYGERVIYTDSLRSKDYVNVFQRRGQGYRKGEEVLVDCLLLARCDFLFKCTSAVGEYAMYFNKKLQCCDLNHSEVFTAWHRLKAHLARRKQEFFLRSK